MRSLHIIREMAVTLKEAYKILGVSQENTDREIKARYKKLLIMYHPDSDPAGKRESKDDEMIRRVIEAYRKIRESEGEPVHDTYEFTWDAFENRAAFSERNIFFQFRIYDEALPPSKMARGRFVWDPDMEEFSMFTKSVLEACKDVMTDHDIILTPEKVKNIFHLMMQEYVLPADAARKLGKKVREDEDKEVYLFYGFIKEEPLAGRGVSKQINNEPLNLFLRDDRAVAEEMVSGKVLGSVSFDEDELYYIVLPLLEDPAVNAHAVITRVENSQRNKRRMHVEIELTIPKNLVDTPVSNARIIKEWIGRV
ncbi:J domain-containing protein [Butyrivibrio sp. LC3010]|uniref:J domain-containing protein n=1 Tax=Butyrivibrio sp. LC3010 TaxID=1280680 RepID=UPI00042718B2|nr:J domain-containing protein [Butyrivibrio sp. LC3010]